MANQWFKFYGGEYLSDPKIERLKPIERSCWMTLLCLASMSENGTIEYLTVESLLNKSGIQFDPYHPEEWESALSVLQKFQNMKMIVMIEDGSIQLVNWNKRQEHNLTPAERMAKMRAKNKRNTTDVTRVVTDNVTNVTLEENRIEENRIDNTFPSFWNSYPNKTNKKKAEELWVSKKLASKLEVILSFLERAKQTDRWTRGFIKAPDVFLRNESWTDELDSYNNAQSSNTSEVYHIK